MSPYTEWWTVNRLPCSRLGRVDDPFHLSALRRGPGQRPQGSPCHAVTAIVGAAARLVAHRTAKGVDVPRPRPHQPDDDATAQPRLPHGRQAGWTAQLGCAAHVATQLRHPPARAEHRYSCDPGFARSRDILPANTRSRGGSTIRSILGVARPCSSSGNTPTVEPRWSSFRSLTSRSPAYPRG